MLRGERASTALDFDDSKQEVYYVGGREQHLHGGTLTDSLPLLRYIDGVCTIFLGRMAIVVVIWVSSCLGDIWHDQRACVIWLSIVSERVRERRREMETDVYGTSLS